MIGTYDINDISLADAGKKRIEWAALGMEVDTLTKQQKEHLGSRERNT